MKLNGFDFKKVVFVGPHPSGMGGISTVLGEYSRAISPFRHGAVNSPRGKVAGLVNLAATFGRLLAYRCAGSSIMHIHYAGRNSWKRENTLAAFGRLIGYKTVMHCHCSLPDLTGNQGKEQVVEKLSKADANLVLATHYRQFAEAELGLKNVNVIANFIEPPSSDQPAETKEASEPVTRFLFLGLLSRPKGFFDLLEAAKLLADSGVRFTITAGGTGDFALVRKRLAELNLENNVELRGWISGADKAEALSQADVLVLPSYTEGMPMVAIEAMQAGCALIGTRVGALPDMIGHGPRGECGIIVEPGDINGLAAAMARLADAKIRKPMKSNALVSGKCYTAAAVLPQLAEIYRKL